jgi:hypothetical protein
MPAAKPAKWEYKIIRVAEVVTAYRAIRGGPIEHDEYDAWVEEYLCSLGAEGWEVVCISPFQDRTLILKRLVAAAAQPRQRKSAKQMETVEAAVVDEALPPAAFG